MSHHITPAVRASRYRQVRVTITQEGSGRLTFSVYAKGLNQAWNEHQCLLRSSLDALPYPLLTTEDVIGVAIDVLRTQMLPGVD